MPIVLPDGKLLYVGSDGQGRELEIVAVPDGDDLIVIRDAHCMEEEVVMSSSKRDRQSAVDPHRYRVTPATVDGGEVDLDQEVVIGPDGVRITDAAAVAYTERRGRPSLSGGKGKSPQVAFRLDPALQSKAEVAAAASGTTVSDLARTALSEWLAVHAVDAT